MDLAFELRVLHLYDAMLDQPPDVRDRWLDRECADDLTLRDAVRALAAAESAAGAMPTIPPEPMAGADDRAAPPDTVGHYRLVSELGRGGMGIVYLGERDDGLFDHKVAIKLMRHTIFSERALAQFAIERRVLARLRHPHIAQMLDGGVTPEGASYIVMERIAGVPITTHCDAEAIDLAGRLALFREATDAIEHAHRNLIVHADIKPNNVFVEPGFGVKLLDFGIARLLDEADTQMSSAHTPGYASPTRSSGLPATPADDIYAAGRLLRDLIAGQASVDADLVAIAAMAAAPDPALRYGSIGALARDLARWQGHMPTVAAPPTRTRRLALFWRRRRLPLTIAVLAFAGLVAALTITLALYLRSERQRVLADARYEQTRALADYIISDIDPDLARLPGALALRRRLVDRTGGYLRALEAARSASPELMLDIAAGYLSMARIYGLDPSGGIGDFPAARRSLDHARTLLAKAAAAGATGPRLLRLRAKAKLVEGSVVFVAPDPVTLRSGLAALESAQALLRDYLRSDPRNVDAQLDLWRAQVMSARAYAYLGEPDAARTIITTNLAKAAIPVRDELQTAERDFILNGSYLMLAEAYEDSDPLRATEYYGRAISHIATMRQRGTAGWQDDFVAASALAGRADMAARLGHTDAAIRDYRASVAKMERLLTLGPNHEVAAFLAYARYALSHLYARLGQYAAAGATSDQAVTWMSGDITQSPDSGLARRLLALALQNRAFIVRRSEGRAAACTADRRAMAAWRDVDRHSAVLPIDKRPQGPIPTLRTLMAMDCRT